MKNVWILFDRPNDDNDKIWLYRELSKLLSVNVNSVPFAGVLSKLERKNILCKCYSRYLIIKQILATLMKAHDGDIFICWLLSSALYLNWILKKIPQKKNCRIISLNWLTPTTSSRKVRFLLKELAKNPNAIRIMNSPDSEKKWDDFLGITTQNSVVIPDVYDDSIPFEHQRTVGRYFFTGGMNNRNWKVIVTLAKYFPEEKFTCVALKKDFEQQVKEVPENVDVFFNLDACKYYELMKHSACILLPLLDTRVAGLINILKAAQFGVPCMITKTNATSQYYNKDSMFLISDENAWVDVLKKWLNSNRNDQEKMTNDFIVYIKENFSPSNAAKKISKLI